MAQYDYIVIGAGSAGSVITRRLVEDTTARVLLLEAGPPDENPNIHAPAGWPATWQTELDYAYMTVPQKHAGNRSHYWPRGRTLGGSSSINGMIYIRGHHSDYDAWAYEGNVGWDYNSVLPFFKKSENYEGGASHYHGVGGPLHVSFNRNPNPACVAAVEAGKAIGLPYTDDFNGEQIEGVGYTHLTVKDGKRQSTAVAFLRPVLGYPNLSVQTGAQARRLLFEGTRCIGVEYRVGDQLLRAEASAEVVVCGGAIASPQLLLLSGIGDANELRRLAIKPLVDLPGVGKNLHDHLLVSVIYEAKQQIPPPQANLLESQLFWKSDPRRVGPDLQPLFMHLPYYAPGFTGPQNAYTLCAGIIRPASRGELRLSAADPDAPLQIDPNYLAEEADMQAMLVAVKLCREIGEAQPLDDWRLREVCPGPDARSAEALREYIRNACGTYHHQVGTCKMGIDAMAVVDPELRVYGVTGLRVADASIMPSVPSGNTNAPSIMVGEKAADLIKLVQSVGYAATAELVS